MNEVNTEAKKAGVAGRARVQELASEDPRAALAVAESIAHPWYRCQALSVAAGVQSGDAARQTLQRALAAAYELAEPNRIVTAASWPVHALITRGVAGQNALVEKLLRTAATEPHSLRRSHALFSLLEAVFADSALRQRVLSELLDALRGSHGWRAERVWGFTVLLMAAESAEAALAVFREMPEGREKRRTERHLTSPAYIGPRWIEYLRG